MYTLTLEITKRCNLKCRYCYVQKNEDMMQLDVGYKSIDISLRQQMRFIAKMEQTLIGLA